MDSAPVPKDEVSEPSPEKAEEESREESREEGNDDSFGSFDEP